MKYFLMIIAAAIAAFSSGEASAQSFNDVEMSEETPKATVSDSGFVMQFELVPGEYSPGILAMVQFPTGQSKLLKFDNAAFGHIEYAIGTLQTNGPQVLILKTYSGGAHCCYTNDLYWVEGVSIKGVSLYTGDAGSDIHEFPKDLDGDGIADFELGDDRFYYSFTYYAASFAPPKFFNFYRGTFVDVSDSESFYPQYELFSAEVWPYCADTSEQGRNGACAAYVASEARLGRYRQATYKASNVAYAGKDAVYPTGCAVQTGVYGCPEGKEIAFQDFRSAIDWFLRDAGYLESLLTN